MNSFVALVSGLALAGSAAAWSGATPAPASTPVRPVSNGLALTPPMGWNSWNRFGCNVSDSLIRGMADAIVASGMRDAGYQYVTIDDCWQVARDANGTIVPDSTRFPHGMKALADYVHAKGLKFGIYTDAGHFTCQHRPGSYGHEAQDAKTYAGWGVDYVKVDWCNAEGINAPAQYAKIKEALLHSGRPIVFSICEWGSNRPWEWADTTGNLWRTTGDIWDSYQSMVANADLNMQYWHAAGPGHWNDPDMLEVGNGGMTRDEYRAHFSLWAIMAAPLIAGNDVRAMVDTTSREARMTRSILLNKEVIAVDQDSLGVQGMVVQDYPPELQVWAKPLQDGSVAVVLFNRASVPSRITANWGRIGIRTRRATVRDLWAHKDLGVVENRYTADVPSHGVVMLRVTPVGQ